MSKAVWFLLAAIGVTSGCANSDGREGKSRARFRPFEFLTRTAFSAAFSAADNLNDPANPPGTVPQDRQIDFTKRGDLELADQNDKLKLH